MAVTKICANKRIAAGSVTSSELADNSVVNAKIQDGAVSTGKVADGAITEVKVADAAITPSKTDATASYTFANLTLDSDTGDDNKVSINGNGSITTQGGELNIQNVAGDTSFLKVDTAGKVWTNGELEVGTNLVVQGDLTVNGTTTSVNSTDTDITDKNITLAKDADAAAAEGAGLTIERTDATDGSFVFSDNYATKWALGLVGEEKEVVDVSTAQTLSNKTYSLVNGDIEGQSDLEAAVRELDDKVNNGTAYSTVELDTSDSKYADGVVTLDEAINDGSVVKVYESGLRLRVGDANDFTVDYANGKITFAEEPCLGANIIIDYIPA